MGIPDRHKAGVETLDWREHDMDAIRRRVEEYPGPTLCPEAARRGEEVCLIVGREGLSAVIDSTSTTESDTDPELDSFPDSDTPDINATDDLTNFIVDWAHSD
jgi:hypothetical protein